MWKVTRFHPRIFFHFSEEEVGKNIVQEEMEEMLKKKAIAPVQNKPDQFVSSIFIVPKKSSGFRPIINLKNLNSYIEFNHFKMEVYVL